MTSRTFENGPTFINDARADVLIKDVKPCGSYVCGDETFTQYLTAFGMVTISTNSWDERCANSLLRYA